MIDRKSGAPVIYPVAINALGLRNGREGLYGKNLQLQTAVDIMHVMGSGRQWGKMIGDRWHIVVSQEAAG